MKDYTTHNYVGAHTIFKTITKNFSNENSTQRQN
jgi:hypothetical protein